jgi:UDP-glucose 4-epimerase
VSKVIVFGGSGFFGSHLVDALIERGHETLVYDLKITQHLNSNCKFIKGDISDLDRVVRATEGCDYVYNCAALSDINEARDLPLETANINITGNLNILEASRLCNVKRFLFASTVYVYSNTGGFYRVSKQASEAYVEAYWERYNLPYTILRYGSLFGRRADDRNGLYRLLKQALQNKKIVYEGSPDTMREYIHVSDAANLSVDAMDPQHENSRLIVTGAEKISVHNLLKMIAEMLPGVETEFSPVPMYGHYVMTPYTFSPKLGSKLVPNKYIDLGQGILDCLSEISDAERTSGSSVNYEI